MTVPQAAQATQHKHKLCQRIICQSCASPIPVIGNERNSHISCHASCSHRCKGSDVCFIHAEHRSRLKFSFRDLLVATVIAIPHETGEVHSPDPESCPSVTFGVEIHFLVVVGDQRCYLTGKCCCHCGVDVIVHQLSRGLPICSVQTRQFTTSYRYTSDCTQPPNQESRHPNTHCRHLQPLRGLTKDSLGLTTHPDSLAALKLVTSPNYCIGDGIVTLRLPLLLAHSDTSHLSDSVPSCCSLFSYCCSLLPRAGLASMDT
ncbi:hypothetical protein F5Y15DRAFT_176415 [Xylariaceae sp. FL0016]|nr:hypothetical protein F5Y15DRAFT_176415 [Xylariaceae sp. FL0016]